MAYTRREILEMRKAGRITKEQAKVMLAETRREPEKKEEPKEDSLKVLAGDIQRLAEAVNAAIQGQGDVVAEMAKFIPIMLATYEAINKEPPSPAESPKSWEVTFTRDRRGLIESPIELRAG
jgi:hypothetical protein